jgi:hypothetical protein
MNTSFLDKCKAVNIRPNSSSEAIKGRFIDHRGLWPLDSGEFSSGYRAIPQVLKSCGKKFSSFARFGQLTAGASSAWCSASSAWCSAWSSPGSVNRSNDEADYQEESTK